MEGKGRILRWQRWQPFGSWLFGAHDYSERSQPFHLMDHLNLFSFFHPLCMIDLIYLDSSEDDNDSDKEINIQRATAKILTVKSALAFPFSMLYILILCF